jgi:branched-chain amino acid transport system permease protein
MRNFINTVARLTRPAYVRWPLLAVFLLGLPWIILIIPIYGANNFTYSQLNQWLILSVIALGLNLLTGLTGMISLGHSAIYQVGAFGAGYFISKAQLPFPVAVIIAAIMGGLVGLILGLPALRLSGPYLAVATFAFAIAVPQLLSSSEQVGELFADPNDITTKIGVFKVPRQVFPGFEVKDDLGRYYLFLVIAAIMVILAMGLWRSRTGRALRAIRDSETAAQAMGVSLARYKVLAFVISGVYAGVAGAMLTAQIGQLEATDLQFSGVESILFLTAIILGGLASIPGSIIGAALLTILPNATNELNNLIKNTFGAKIENFESIFYGLIIILCIFFMPNGIAGAFRTLAARWRGDNRQHSDPGPLASEPVSPDTGLNVSGEMVGEARKGV